MLLETVNVFLAGVGLITGVWSKFFLIKLKKHERLSVMESNVLGRINKTLNESFKDEHIRDQEFRKVLKDYQNHSKPSKNVFDTFIDQPYVEKSQIKRILMSFFSLSKA